jgi:hypothetical protein
VRADARRGDPAAALEVRLRRLVADPFAVRGLQLAAAERAGRLAALRRRRARWRSRFDVPHSDWPEFSQIARDLDELGRFDQAETAVRRELRRRLQRIGLPAGFLRRP